jgi:hypothetical protein
MPKIRAKTNIRLSPYYFFNGKSSTHRGGEIVIDTSISTLVAMSSVMLQEDQTISLIICLKLCSHKSTRINPPASETPDWFLSLIPADRHTTPSIKVPSLGFLFLSLNCKFCKHDKYPILQVTIAANYPIFFTAR